MKYYNLDLIQIVPYGVPINSEDHVEYRNHINEFFLKGFELFYKQLFKTRDSMLTLDIAKSLSAPMSLETCMLCNDQQLNALIAEAGFNYYPANDHAINAKFLYDINTIPFGTNAYLTAIAHYVANSNTIECQAVYTDNPYIYILDFYGDVTSTENSATIVSRMIPYLNIIGTAHTKIDEIVINDEGTNIHAYIGVVCDDWSDEYTITIDPTI